MVNQQTGEFLLYLMGRPGGEWGQIFYIITQDTRKVEL